MSQRNMRLVLEEGNALTLRDEEGVCLQVKDNLILKGHTLLLSSEDLSYITYDPSGFHYTRYDPQDLSVEEEYSVLIETNEFEGENEDIFPLAAYSPINKKAFFFIISKTTRKMWVLEKDLVRKAEGEFPGKGMIQNIKFKKDVAFDSSYVGIGSKKSTVFLFGTDSKGKWHFAVDIPKDRDGQPELVGLDEPSDRSPSNPPVVRRRQVGRSFLFGKGVNPRTISVGRGGYIKFSKPHDDEAMVPKNDSFLPYRIRYTIPLEVGLTIVIPLLFSGLMAYSFFYLLPSSWFGSVVGIDCKGNSTFDCVEGWLIDALLGILFLGSGTCLVIIYCMYELNSKFRTWVCMRSGRELGHDPLRASKKYHHTIERFENYEHFSLVSQHLFAFNQGNKIQIFDSDSRQIVETLHDSFNGYRLLKQDYDSNWVCAYNIDDEFLRLKVCNFQSRKVNRFKLQLTPQHSSLVPKPNIGNTTLHPQPTLRRVLIDYQEDAYEPFKPNKRVSIYHSTNPMRLIIQSPPNSGQIDFYTRLRSSSEVWSTLKQISNLTDFVHEHDNENEVVFELDKEKTLVHEDDFFDHISQRGEGTFAEDGRLRLRKGNKELAPSLETAIFLENHINHPVTVFLSNFSDNFPQLMKSLWVGDKNQEIHQLVEVFKIEDDLPAMSYIQGKEGEYEGASPKQNTEMWHDWQNYLPSTELDAVFDIIKEKELWPRNGHAHQMMHGDLRPANIVVNAGEIIEDEFVYDLFLCDFPDVVAKSGDGEILYRTEIVAGTHRVSSHFFETEKAPKINPMLDLARFFAYMLIKIPFEPTAKDAVGLAKEKRNRRTQARNARQADFKDTVREQLDRALTWSENNLLADLDFYLVEEGTFTEDSWRELLKAMIFDQCLQIMMHWKRGRSEAAIENDLTPENLCEIFYDVSPTPPDLIVEEDLSDRELMRMAAARVYAADQDQPWNEEVVKLEITDYRADLDPTNTTLHEYDVSYNHLPEIMEKVIENGFPINSFRRETSTRSDRDCFSFRFEVENFHWRCSCYIEGETMVISYMHEDLGWGWEWDPHWS